MSDEKTGQTEQAVLKSVIDWILDAENGVQSVQRMAKLINGVGAAVSHAEALSSVERVEELKDSDNWRISPKELVVFLLERDLLLDRDEMAASYNNFHTIVSLERLYDLPSADEPPISDV